MKQPLLAITILSAMLGATAAQAAEPMGAPKPDREKCYGVAKVGKNDCSAKDGSHACAGQVKKDSDINNWIYVPKGLCDKLAGGNKA